MLAVYLPHSSAENHDAHTSSTNSCLLSSAKFSPVQWSSECQQPICYQVERFKRVHTVKMSSLKCRPAPRSSLDVCRRLHGVTIPAKLRKRSSASSTARRFSSTPEPPSCRFVPCLFVMFDWRVSQATSREKSWMQRWPDAFLLQRTSVKGQLVIRMWSEKTFWDAAVETWGRRGPMWLEILELIF